ncbi:MAG: TonB-dependent receptor [Bacteroidota bacterium]
MRKIFFLLSISALFYQAHAQSLTQTIKGRVLDAQSSTPIIGANVVVINSNPILGGTTDLEGYFKIKNVPIGRHNIRVSYIGYEDKIIPELLVGSGKEVVLNVDLTESLIELEDLVITATQEKGEPLNEMASVSALSFSVEQTSRYAATFDDPARAALSFAGVTGGGDDASNEIVVRGNSPRGILWRLEGVEIPNPNHFAEVGSSGGIVSMLSANMLSNSDFFTGAFPAQYGNALSGVFDINLRNGNHDKREYALQAGLLGLAGSAEGPIGKSRASYLVNYRYSTLALFDNIGVEVVDPQEEIIFQDLSFKFHIPTQKAGAFSIWGLRGDSEYNYLADEEFDPFNENSRNKLNVAGLTHTFYLDSDTYLESIFSYSSNKNLFELDSMSVFVDELEEVENTAARASFLLNKKFNAKNTLRTGVIISRLGFDLLGRFRNDSTQQFITLLDQRGNTNFYQAYGQWQHRINQQLTLNSGIHASYFGLNNNYSIEPRAGLRWNLGNQQVFSAGFGLHSRLESTALYLAQEQAEDGSLSLPNKDLELTKSLHFVLGYEKKLREDLRLKTEVYYQHLYNVPVRPITSTRPWERSFSALNERDGYTTDTLVNEGTGHNYGLELTLEKFFTNNYYFVATSSLYQSKYKGIDGILRNTRFNGNFIANLIVGKEFKVGRNDNNLIGLNGRLIWAGGQRTIPIDLEASRTEGNQVLVWEQAFKAQLPHYFRMDIGISYRKNKPNRASIISLNVQNFTGRYNVFDEFYSSGAQRIITDEQLGLFPNLSYRVEF